MEINNDLLTQYRLLSANPKYWEIDMSKVDLVKAAAIAKSILRTGICCEVPVVTCEGMLDTYRPMYKCQHGHTVLYAALRVYALGDKLTDEQKRTHYERHEHVMCLVLNDEVRPCVPAFDTKQSDQWVAELLQPYQ